MTTPILQSKIHTMENKAADIIAKLKTTPSAFAGRTPDQPVIAFLHNRFHFISLGVVCNPRMKTHEGITGVNFMSISRAEETISDWLPYCVLKPFPDICASLPKELETKVLPTAEDYRPLLIQGHISVVGGFTTDTLKRMPADDIDKLIARIANMMESGHAGPFLHFTRSF